MQNKLAEKEVARRYWEAFKNAIEEYVAAVEKNENGYMIHGLARVVRLRETELAKIERKAA